MVSSSIQAHAGTLQNTNGQSLGLCTRAMAGKFSNSWGIHSPQATQQDQKSIPSCSHWAYLIKT